MPRSQPQYSIALLSTLTPPNQVLEVGPSPVQFGEVGFRHPASENRFLSPTFSSPTIRYNTPRSKALMSKPTPFRLVLLTCATLAEARIIARSVVEKKLAACVNILPIPVESIYSWQSKIETTSEHLLLLKTSETKLKPLEKEVLRLHSYDTPEFIALPISEGSTAYLKWLASSLPE
jgi:periplasmic divalent cation tolerance protein